jgi:NIPSNAP
MSKVSKRTSFLGLTLLLAALAFGTKRMSAAGDARPAAAAPAAGAGAGAGAGQFFELRVYTAAPGKMDALNRRFREHSLKFFEKHGIKSVGYWTAVDEQHRGRLYYVIAYPDRESRERMLVNGIAKDPEFLKVVAESEKDGKLTDGIESVLMTPTDYSPLK